MHFIPFIPFILSKILIWSYSIVPPGPVVYYREFDTPLPTLSLRRSPNTLDLIRYQPAWQGERYLIPLWILSKQNHEILHVRVIFFFVFFSSLYQVFVLPVEGIMMFNCSSPPIASPLRTLKSPAEYITAQFEVHRVGTEMNLTIGDGLLYGGFHNAPLESGKNYYIILRAVSQWKSVSAAVLWFKSNDWICSTDFSCMFSLLGLKKFLCPVG